MDLENTFSYKTDHFYMLSYIDSKIEELLIHWKWIHVMGHKDNHIRHLDRWDTLNIECDHTENIRWTIEQEKLIGHIPTHIIEDETWRL